MGDDDVQRLEAILSMAEKHRLALGVVRVGDIQVQIAGRIPIEQPKPEIYGLVEVKTTGEVTEAEKEAWLVGARRRSKEQFGYIKGDETLWAMRGVL